MGDVLVQHSPHIQRTPTHRRWFQGVHNIPKPRAKEIAEPLKIVVPPHTWPAPRKDALHSKLPATITKQVDQPRKSVEVQSTPQRQDQVKETPENSPSKSPPSSRKPSIPSSSNLT